MSTVNDIMSISLDGETIGFYITELSHVKPGVSDREPRVKFIHSELRRKQADLDKHVAKLNSTLNSWLFRNTSSENHIKLMKELVETSTSLSREIDFIIKIRSE